MSKIGKLPISLPDSVDVEINGKSVKVSGPKGEHELELPDSIETEIDDGELKVTRTGDTDEVKSFHGLYRSLLSNMIQGVSEGFERTLEIIGTGYRASQQGDQLILKVGYSHPAELEIPEDLEIEIEDGEKVTVKGIDKQKVGYFASQIREVRKPNPYTGDGIKYEDEEVERKPGKATQAGEGGFGEGGEF